MIRKLSIGAALAAVMLAGAPAQAANGCQKIATGIGSMGGGGCTYTATGPGVYAVATASGFRISWQRGPDTISGPARVSVPNNPETGVWAGGGEIATIADDIVTIAIGTASAFVPTCPNPVCNGGVLRWQDGFIAANDKP